MRAIVVCRFFCNAMTMTTIEPADISQVAVTLSPLELAYHHALSRNLPRSDDAECARATRRDAIIIYISRIPCREQIVLAILPNVHLHVTNGSSADVLEQATDLDIRAAGVDIVAALKHLDHFLDRWLWRRHGIQRRSMGRTQCGR